MKLTYLMDSYYRGEQGRTLFHEPYPKKVTDPDDTFFMLQQIHDTQDQRAYVVVAALVAEAMVNKILALLLPSYRVGEEPASRKISMLQAFRIIPDHLLEAATLVHDVRNKFAHFLDVASFEQLVIKFPKIVDRLKAFGGQRGLRHAHDGNAAGLFEEVSILATGGLNRYVENVRFYVELTRSADFIQALAQRNQHEHREHLAVVVEALRQHQSAPITDSTL